MPFAATLNKNSFEYLKCKKGHEGLATMRASR